MKAVVFGALCCVIALQPAFARSSHRRHFHSARRSHEVGLPITAESGSIRINAVGEVISKPTPVIRKEQKFDSQARKDLSGKPDPMSEPNPPARP